MIACASLALIVSKYVCLEFAAARPSCAYRTTEAVTRVQMSAYFASRCLCYYPP